MSVAEGLPGRVVWGVGALLLAANDTLQARFGACAVRGELSGFSRAASGHCYFTLKDADGSGASLRCAMFRRAAALLDFVPRDGQQVELRGRLSVYEARGELQLVVESMQRVGAGTLFEEFLRLKAKLEVQGLFDSQRKRPLPVHPRTVGVITSLGAAALRDVLTALARRAPHLQVVVYPSVVQGAEAPAALCQALRQAWARAEADVLILCRGGGSLEDMWAFNDEQLVRAVAQSPIPLVCGVGHETDVTLCDLAADLRAPTPTAAAELVAPMQADLLAQLQALALRQHRALGRRLEGHAMQLDRAALRLARPAQLLSVHAQRLERLDTRRLNAWVHATRDRRSALHQAAAALRRAADRLQQHHGHRLAVLQSRLQALDPRGVLRRGYVWIADEDGRPVVSAAQVMAGQPLQAVWADGRAQMQVTSVQAESGPPNGS